MLIDLHSANFLCLQKVTICLLLSTLSDDHGHGAKIEDDSRMHLHHNTKLTNFRKITRKPISTSSSPNEKKIPKCKTHLSTLTQSTHSLCHDPPVVAPCHYCPQALQVLIDPESDFAAVLVWNWIRDWFNWYFIPWIRVSSSFLPKWSTPGSWGLFNLFLLTLKVCAAPWNL